MPLVPVSGIDRLLAVEEEVAALYRLFARRFAGYRELALLWSELAEDEAAQAKALGEIRGAVLRGEIAPSLGHREEGLLDNTLRAVRRHRAEAEGDTVSAAQALATTITLETSEINEVFARLVEAVRPAIPSLPMLEVQVRHLRRLVSAVDRLSHPELTAVLKTLTERVERWRATLPKILIADDEADMRDTCVRIFQRDGYQCLAVTDGQEAIAALEREHPDLILADLRMPRVDGLALIRHVRELSQPPPVVIFTAYASETSFREALAAGAAAYLPKPFTPQKLREVVEPLLPRRGPMEWGAEGMAGEGSRA